MAKETKEELGLLPCEAYFAAKGHQAQMVVTRAAGEKIGVALDNKPSGDWGGDDTGIQSVQEEHHVQKQFLGKLAALMDLDMVDYPDPDSDEVAIGSAFTLEDEYGLEDYWLGTRAGIQDMPALDNRTLVSATSPLGEAVFGRRIGDQISWEVNANVLVAQVVSIDQTLVPETYGEIIDSELLPQSQD